MSIRRGPAPGRPSGGGKGSSIDSFSTSTTASSSAGGAAVRPFVSLSAASLALRLGYQRGDAPRASGWFAELSLAVAFPVPPVVHASP